MGFGRGALLWLLGVPLPIILLLALFWHHCFGQAWVSAYSFLLCLLILLLGGFSGLDGGPFYGTGYYGGGGLGLVVVILLILLLMGCI